MFQGQEGFIPLRNQSQSYKKAGCCPMSSIFKTFQDIFAVDRQYNDLFGLFLTQFNLPNMLDYPDPALGTNFLCMSEAFINVIPYSHHC